MEVRDAWKRIFNATKIEDDDAKPTCLIDVSEIDFERKMA
jgi:hypothetical protein